MKLFYTEKSSGFKDGYAYRNPVYFGGVEDAAIKANADGTSVTVSVEGDFAEIVEAYEAAGIEVKLVKTRKAEKAAVKGELATEATEVAEATEGKSKQ